MSTSPAPESAAALPGSEVIGRRILAGLLDGALLLVVFVVVAIATGGSSHHGGSFNASTGTGGTVLFAAVALAYYGVLEAATGQTLGKRVTGLRVVRQRTGERADGVRVAIRTVLRLVDALPFLYLLGLVVMLVTGRRAQRLGDLAGGTQVVAA